MRKGTRKIWALLLAGIMTAGCLTGCGKSVSTKENVTQSKEASIGEASKAGTETTEKATQEEAKKEPITTDPITISILTTRHTTATNDANELWYFKYLEWWMAQQGYDVTIEVQQTLELEQQISLMLGTDTLPDLVWGIPLSTQDAVVYGATEGMILDWSPYLNEETMPTLYGLMQDNPDALVASTCSDGGIYGLPYLDSRGYRSSTGNMSVVERVYIDQRWLDACSLEVPETMEDFLDMLRAFKDVETESGEAAIPLVSNADFLEKYLWISLGYYGSDLSKYGTVFSIKDEEVYLPAATEDYRTFIETMHTLYEEGLISQDHFSMDTTTSRGLMQSGICGVMCDYTLGYANSYPDMVSAKPIALGGNDDVVVSAASTYKVNQVWASADTEYPEVLAMLLDYVWSDEGSSLYSHGPYEGQDPLGMLDGWFYDENDNMTTKLIENGTYTDYETYARQYIYSNMYVGNGANINRHAYETAGRDYDVATYTYIDKIRGEEVSVDEKTIRTEEDAVGHWVIQNAAAWQNNVTTIRLPGVYMSEEDSIRASELKSVLDSHITSESAKFITGIRPLSEIDAFFEELKQMDVEEYVELYRTAYSSYMDSVF